MKAPADFHAHVLAFVLWIASTLGLLALGRVGGYWGEVGTTFGGLSLFFGILYWLFGHDPAQTKR